MEDTELDKIIKKELDELQNMPSRYNISKHKRFYIKKAIYKIIQEYQDILIERIHHDKKMSVILKELFFDVKYNYPETTDFMDKKMAEKIEFMRKYPKEWLKEYML